ncbi:MAG: hypothetical protein GEU80_15110 [Dehalococcoidia bacterium]|nr:hypothetical protein [Dehalococcoidia bacterium]
MTVDPGLCARCLWARPIRSARGSVYWRCGRSDEGARFPRYPRLPVVACAGFEVGETSEGR